MFSKKELTVAAWAAFASWLLIAISQATPVHIFARLGQDFIQFYGAGQILNDHANLYDTVRQDQLLQQYCPVESATRFGSAIVPVSGCCFVHSRICLIRPLSHRGYSSALVFIVWDSTHCARSSRFGINLPFTFALCHLPRSR
jgi:hypothetical protein